MIVVIKKCQQCGKEKKVIESEITPVHLNFSGYVSEWIECNKCHSFSIVLTIDLKEKEKECVPMD